MSQRVLVALVMSGSLFAQSVGLRPARRLSGTLPPPAPPDSIGGIAETLQLNVDASGRVSSVTPLQTSGGASVLAAAVADWRFRPAVEGGQPVPSGVLVAALYRAPALYNTADAGGLGQMVAIPAADVPVPRLTPPPPYPPLGASDAVVLVEVLVGPDGRVQTASVINGSPGFDGLALAAARAWTFGPAQRGGRTVSAFAYIAFGFRRPITA